MIQRILSGRVLSIFKRMLSSPNPTLKESTESSITEEASTQVMTMLSSKEHKSLQPSLHCWWSRSTLCFSNHQTIQQNRVFGEAVGIHGNYTLTVWRLSRRWRMDNPLVKVMTNATLFGNTGAEVGSTWHGFGGTKGLLQVHCEHCQPVAASRKTAHWDTSGGRVRLTNINDLLTLVFPFAVGSSIVVQSATICLTSWLCFL